MQAAKEQLAARAGDISYSQLYRAVLALADGAAECPACGTALDAVAQNPFERAHNGLQQLAELAAIQDIESEANRQLGESVRALWEEMKSCVSIAGEVCPEALQAAGLPELPNEHTGNWLEAWLSNENQAWNALLALATLIAQVDANTRQQLEQRAVLAQERDRLNGFVREIEALKALRNAAENERNQAQQTVTQFDEANRELITQVAAEEEVIAFNQRVKSAYDVFLAELQRYMAALPTRLLQGLAEQAKNLYNAINRGDPANYLLHVLRLPIAEHGRIEVEFCGEPGVPYDALIILSEGHIKCLGLAILLAKNISQDCPLVIFDDVVNAIDDEHRDGIWRTFFEDGWLDGKQIVLTSHAEEFLHRIEQELGAHRARQIKRYRFLPHQGEHELRIDTDPPSKNYVLLAQQAHANDSKRDALRYARAALESLTDRAWTWLGRRTDGRIELRLSGPKSPWELNNKCTKLKSAIDRIANQHSGAPEVVASLTRLLGVGGGSIEWGYLNSGTHDSQRDHEFDRATVMNIVESVVSLDEALAILQGR